MKILFLKLILFVIFLNINNQVSSAGWCKVIYNQETSEGKLESQLSKCKNSDNLFLAIHSGFFNAGHLMNSMIAENCDIRRNILITKPRQSDPYFTAVCEYRVHSLR